MPQVYLHNLAELNPSLVNDEAVTNFKKLGHGDVFAVGDRRFRLEYSKSHYLLSFANASFHVFIFSFVSQLVSREGYVPLATLCYFRITQADALRYGRCMLCKRH